MIVMQPGITTAGRPGFLFERMAVNCCNTLVMRRFLFEWKTSV